MQKVQYTIVGRRMRGANALVQDEWEKKGVGEYVVMHGPHKRVELPSLPQQGMWIKRSDSKQTAHSAGVSATDMVLGSASVNKVEHQNIYLSKSERDGNIQISWQRGRIDTTQQQHKALQHNTITKQDKTTQGKTITIHSKDNHETIRTEDKTIII